MEVGTRSTLGSPVEEWKNGRRGVGSVKAFIGETLWAGARGAPVSAHASGVE